MIKYITYPDYVRSKYDGDVHYISHVNLVELYRVNYNECVCSSAFNTGNYSKGLIKLKPKYNGDYIIDKNYMT